MVFLYHLWSLGVLWIITGLLLMSGGKHIQPIVLGSMRHPWLSSSSRSGLMRLSMSGSTSLCS